MIHYWHDLPPGPHPPEEVTAVIEIPFGSRNKYELDKKTGIMKLDRVLYSAVHYPGDYGLIPRTLHEDGDPLDVLVLVKEQTFPGCLIDVRPLGVLIAQHDDDRLGAADRRVVPCTRPQQAAVLRLPDDQEPPGLDVERRGARAGLAEDPIERLGIERGGHDVGASHAGACAVTEGGPSHKGRQVSGRLDPPVIDF